MPIVNIRKGSQITQTDNEIIELQVPGTKFWIQGEQLDNHLWNIYLTNPITSYKQPIRKNIPTQDFSTFVNIILGKQLPYPTYGKKAESPVQIRKIIKKLTKKQHDPRKQRPSSIRNKSSKLQINRKKRS